MLSSAEFVTSSWSLLLVTLHFEGKQDVMENTEHSASYETLSKYLHVCPIVEAVCSFLHHVQIYALLMGAALHYAAIAWNGSGR